MSDEVINARLAEYLGRYTTFAMPAGDNATSGARLRARKMWTAPRSAVRGIGGGVLALALVAALVVALGIGFGLRSRTQTAQSVGSTSSPDHLHNRLPMRGTTSCGSQAQTRSGRLRSPLRRVERSRQRVRSRGSLQLECA